MRRDRRAVRAVVLLVPLLLTAGCAARAAGTTPGPDPAAAVTGTVRSAAAATRSTALPAELVGRWTGDDPRNVGSWTLELGADGSYRESNDRRGVSIEGRAAVAGRRLYLQPFDADSRTITWQVTGSTLILDGVGYRRG